MTHALQTKCTVTRTRQNDITIEVPLDDAEARLVAKRLKASRTRRQKSRPSTGPIRLVLADVARLDPAQRRAAIHTQLDHLNGLPKQSRFAEHRRRMLRKALQLLSPCAPRQNQQPSWLTELLCSPLWTGRTAPLCCIGKATALRATS